MRALFMFICTALLSLQAVESAADKELFRIRIENRRGGLIQASSDAGADYSLIGRVRRHAVAYYTGFPASAYVPDGSVAAVAVHGIRLKIGTLKEKGRIVPLSISLVPSDFDATPVRYGGHIPYGSGIYTDIKSGTGLFRELAPFVGSKVFLEKKDSLMNIPERWKPSEGDVIVIICALPEPYIREIVFENISGGMVTAVYEDGRNEHIAKTIRPVSGVGRFDGTSRTGVGAINTNHGGVITISTAPVSDADQLEGVGKERRGGFEIQPSAHAATQYAMPQAMVIAPIESDKPLEGRPPLFFGYIGLAWDIKNPDRSFRVEIDCGSGEYKPMPRLIGKQDSILKKLNVVRFRIVFPRYDEKFTAEALRHAKSQALKNWRVIKGIFMLKPSAAIPDGAAVEFLIDGVLQYAANYPPYEYAWDTRKYKNGEHQAAVRVTDRSGRVIKDERLAVWIEN